MTTPKVLTTSQIEQLLYDDTVENERKAPTTDVLYRHGYDKASLFLLDLHPDNMFEPWDASRDDIWFRCKGCRRKVKRTGRQSHFDWHKREIIKS